MKILYLYSILLLNLASQSYASNPKVILVFGGKTGYLGQKMVQTLQAMGYNPVCAESRLENGEDMEREITRVKPDFIINTAGLTGKSNLDWCETHRPETIRVNIIGTLNLIDIAYRHNVHVTNISTGALYKFDDKHPVGSGIGFTEEDEPNFDKAFYTKMKIYLEKVMLEYPNVLNLRITMPISADFHPKNFLMKVLTYKKVMTLPISLTVLEDLWPIAVDLTLKGKKGNYNFVNPGAISLNEILDLYKEHINPDQKYEVFSSMEQIKMLQTGRSNCELSVSKLLQEYPEVSPIKQSIQTILKTMKDLKK
jgi:dTDP-4-dehydrorhamnose reductase